MDTSSFKAGHQRGTQTDDGNIKYTGFGAFNLPICDYHYRKGGTIPREKESSTSVFFWQTANKHLNQYSLS